MNCGKIYEDLIDHRSYTHNYSSCEILKPEKKKLGLNGIRTYDLSDSMFYQLSYQALS